MLRRCLYLLLKQPWRLRQAGLQTKEEVKKAAEILLVGFIINFYLMPGLHQHFQFWLLPIFPLVLLMTGFPPWLLYSLYSYLYPVL